MIVLYCPVPPWDDYEVEAGVLQIAVGDPFGLTSKGVPYVDYEQVTPGDQARVLLDMTTGKVMVERMV